MLRTALLGGNTINLDSDYSKYIETVSDPGIIEGLEISSGSVAPGKAWVKATRSNRETIMVLVQNTEAFAVDTAGTKKIWLEIRQEAIDNGLLNNEDGTGIASIKTGPTLPSQNSLLLASVDNGRLTDQRAMIPKIQSIQNSLQSLIDAFNQAKPGIDAAAKMPEKIQGLESIVDQLTQVNGVKQILDKKVEGRASASWVAPANGLLEYTYGSDNRDAWIAGINLPTKGYSGIPHYLYVSKNQEITLSVNDGHRQGTYKICLTAFIPL